MTAPWMPPLPEPAAYRWQSTVGGWAYGQRRDINPHAFAGKYAIEKLYTADQTRARDAEVARAALEQAAKVCDEFQRQHGDSDNHGAFLALRIRALAKEIT